MQFRLLNNELLDIRKLLEGKYLDVLSYPVTCYQVYGIDLVEFKSNSYFLLELAEDHIVILAALKPFKFDNTFADIVPFGNGMNFTPQITKFNEGAYMFIINLCKENGYTGPSALKEEIFSLISIFYDREFIYRECFDFTLMSRGNVRSSGPINLKRNKVGIDLNKFENLHQVITKINSFPDSRKQMVYLSLKWYRKHFIQKPVDSFLMLWIAIEIIGECEGSNIKNINKALGQMYKMTSQDVGDNLFIGRLQSVRGDLIHEGKYEKIDNRIILYMENIYIDLLEYKLGLECKNRTLEYIRNNNFMIMNYISE